MKKLLMMTALSCAFAVQTIPAFADATAAQKEQIENSRKSVGETLKTDDGCKAMCEEMMKHEKAKKMMCEMMSGGAARRRLRAGQLVPGQGPQGRHRHGGRRHR